MKSRYRHWKALLLLIPFADSFLVPRSTALRRSVAQQGLFGPNDPAASDRSKNTPPKTEDSVTNTDGTVANSTIETYPFPLETNGNTIGIGGDGGLIYDVNRVKGNLYQETMRAYKAQLFRTLQLPTTSEHEITEQLAALVQGSGVRMTTDSNLLDGGCWTLCYTSKFNSMNDLRRPFELSRKSEQEQLPSMRRLAGKEPFWKSECHEYHLEELPNDLDPYIEIHTHYCGGLWTKHLRYAVRGLSRQSLRLTPTHVSWTLFNRVVRKDNVELQSNIPPREVKICYADVDLCIASFDRGETYSVYTKQDEYSRAISGLRRRIQFAVVNAWAMLTMPLRPKPSPIRRRPTNLDPILKEIVRDSAKLRVLKLGDLSQDDLSWEGAFDPFVHLTADERQRLLKTLNVKQVSQAGQIKRSQNRRRAWLQRLFPFRRNKKFQKPE